ncbi:MAG: hypothetical protein GXY83_32945 [Rhodopirellula sp.]|nr:hypothetical protein [Rhodopirellula sp.]
MKKRHGDLLVLFATVMLLLLTAWGNALAMAIISGIGCIVTLAVLAWRAPGWRVFGRRLLGVTVAFAVAGAIAALMSLW